MPRCGLLFQCWETCGATPAARGPGSVWGAQPSDPQVLRLPWVRVFRLLCGCSLPNAPPPHRRLNPLLKSPQKSRCSAPALSNPGSRGGVAACPPLARSQRTRKRQGFSLSHEQVGKAPGSWELLTQWLCCCRSTFFLLEHIARGTRCRVIYSERRPSTGGGHPSAWKVVPGL